MRVSGGHIRDDALRRVREGTRWPGMPLTVVGPRGELGKLKRQCTEEYKVRPIRRWVREALLERGERVAYLSLGISLDEAERVRPSGVSYIVHEYPLLERRMTREACAAWLQRHGYPEPPKSACIGCPYHGDGYWARLRRDSPSEWEEAVAFDRAIRALPGVRGACYVHRLGLPLEGPWRFLNPTFSGRNVGGFAGCDDGLHTGLFSGSLSYPCRGPLAPPWPPGSGRRSGGVRPAHACGRGVGGGGSMGSYAHGEVMVWGPFPYTGTGPDAPGDGLSST